jgi:hypothetical protein
MSANVEGEIERLHSRKTHYRTSHSSTWTEYLALGLLVGEKYFSRRCRIAGSLMLMSSSCRHAHVMTFPWLTMEKRLLGFWLNSAYRAPPSSAARGSTIPSSVDDHAFYWMRSLHGTENEDLIVRIVPVMI